MQLELTNQSAKLTSVNPRAEFHGESTQPAVDLTFEYKTVNDDLSELHPSLKAMFYENGSAQEDMLESLTKLRFDKLNGPFAWDWQGVGFVCRIPFGIDDSSAIVLPDCKVGKIKFAPLEGGSVAWKITVQTAATGALIGRVCDLLGTEVQLTIEPPALVVKPEPLFSERPENQAKSSQEALNELFGDPEGEGQAGEEDLPDAA